MSFFILHITFGTLGVGIGEVYGVGTYNIIFMVAQRISLLHKMRRMEKGVTINKGLHLIHGRPLIPGWADRRCGTTRGTRLPSTRAHTGAYSRPHQAT